ncbi:MAG: hypothetical protein MUP85_01415 [Candidatus Lokiarchaeota archaeon]|nr:hypothetical protein [Candidatus Lokiarchaeota archaeon]
MDVAEIIKQAKRIVLDGSKEPGVGVLAEAKEFIRVYAGSQSEFLKQLNKVNADYSGDSIYKETKRILEAFIRYFENGLHQEISIERKAQIDVVSDFLAQAQELLNNKAVLSAAPTVLIGASLEEFLRSWIEAEGISIGSKKHCLDTYSKELYEAKNITKQDLKDITSWSGLRNHAAHGEWDEVSDKKRINLMLESVNLFMRKYSKSGV